MWNYYSLIVTIMNNSEIRFNLIKLPRYLLLIVVYYLLFYELVLQYIFAEPTFSKLNNLEIRIVTFCLSVILFS